MLKVAVPALLLVSGVAVARPHVDTNGNLIRDAQSCGTHQVSRTPQGTEPLLPPAPPTSPVIIFLNTKGGTYNITDSAPTSSKTNSANTDTAGDSRQHLNAVIPAIDSQFDWPYILQCVKTAYKPYNVTITETEPTSGDYVEAAIGGDGTATGWDSSQGILGVAGTDTFCSLYPRGIAFVMSTNHIGITKQNDELCATIVHEVGHVLSLEHEIESKDEMSYVPFATAGSKAFQDLNSHCGTDAQTQNNCSCTTTGSGQVTDSALRLKQNVGLRPTETVPPTLDVTSPSDNNTVPPNFSVVANATDDTAMDQVAALVGTTIMASSSSPMGSTYTIPFTNVPEGTYTLEVQAIDLSGNMTKKDIPITVALLQTGDTCAMNEDCHGGICATNADMSQFCSQDCANGMACPDNFTCSAISDSQSICIPSSGGGCNVGGGDRGALAVFVGGALALLLRRRRR
ncbi:MAG: Ig-like domain-containing protein [Kofleriaceae bacterium]